MACVKNVTHRRFNHHLMFIRTMMKWTLSAHPYPARKPRLGGLTLSLKIIMGKTSHDSRQLAILMSHHSGAPLPFRDVSLIRDKVTSWYPSSPPDQTQKQENKWSISSFTHPRAISDICDLSLVKTPMNNFIQNVVMLSYVGSTWQNSNNGRNIHL